MYPLIDPGTANALIAPTHRESDTVFHDPSTQSASWMSRALMARAGKLDDSSVPFHSPLTSGSDGDGEPGGDGLGEGDGEEEDPPPHASTRQTHRSADIITKPTFWDRSRTGGVSLE